MKTQRSAPPARPRDLDIHETLAAGFTPEQAAARHGISVMRVHSAARRVQASQEELGPASAALQRQRLVLGIIVRQAMQAYQRSAVEGEVVTTVKSHPTREGHLAQRTVRMSPGNAVYLNVALKALAQEARLLGLEDLPPETPPTQDSKFLVAQNQALLMHPDMMSFIDTFWDKYNNTGLPPPPPDAQA